MTCYMWHRTKDLWNMTCDMVLGLSILSYSLWFMFFKDLEEKNDSVSQWVNESVTKVFVEHPRLHRVC